MKSEKYTKIKYILNSVMSVRMLVMVFFLFFECLIQIFQLDQFHLYLMLFILFSVARNHVFKHLKLFTWNTTLRIHNDFVLHSLIAGNIPRCPKQCKDKQTRGYDVQETFHLSGRTSSVFCRLDELFIGLVDLHISILNVFLNFLDFIFLAE